MNLVCVPSGIFEVMKHPPTHPFPYICDSLEAYLYVAPTLGLSSDGVIFHVFLLSACMQLWIDLYCFPNFLLFFEALGSAIGPRVGCCHQRKSESHPVHA